MEIEIREASPDDAAAIARLNQQIALETEGKSPDNVWWIQNVYVTRTYRRLSVLSTLYAANQPEARNDPVGHGSSPFSTRTGMMFHWRICSPMGR